MNCDVSCAFCARVIAALAPEPAAPRVEPRRPQVGDEVVILHDSGAWRAANVTESMPGGLSVICACGRVHFENGLDEGVTWRWQATQGAAVAEPVKECVHGTGPADPCPRCEAYFHNCGDSTPPRCRKFPGKANCGHNECSIGCNWSGK